MPSNFVNIHSLRVRNSEPQRRFERLTTIGQPFRIRDITFVVCQCDCGTCIVTREHQLTSGNVRSCNCLRMEILRKGKHHEGHGAEMTAEYKTWVGIKTRCYRKTARNYPDYGGRGIIVCDRWLKSYLAFLEDMGRKPSDAHSIERKNTNGNYEPGNCVWATDVEQANNKRTNVKLTFYGKTMTVMQWCQISGVKPATAYKRIANKLCSEKEAIWARTLRG